jgi:hypothetical protein
VYDIFAYENQATADKPDAGNNLRGDSRRVETQVIVNEYVGESILGHEREERSGESH